MLSKKHHEISRHLEDTLWNAPPEEATAWHDWVQRQGYDVLEGGSRLLRDRPKEIQWHKDLEPPMSWLGSGDSSLPRRGAPRVQDWTEDTVPPAVQEDYARYEGAPEYGDTEYPESADHDYWRQRTPYSGGGW